MTPLLTFDPCTNRKEFVASPYAYCPPSRARSFWSRQVDRWRRFRHLRTYGARIGLDPFDGDHTYLTPCNAWGWGGDIDVALQAGMRTPPWRPPPPEPKPLGRHKPPKSMSANARKAYNYKAAQ